MKALTLYPKEEMYFRKVLNDLKDYGNINCDYSTFMRLYSVWHTKNFPGRPISANTIYIRNDWFLEFVDYMANSDI